MSSAGTIRLVAGRYRLGHRVASGDLAEVWRGTDVVLARPVAVKLLLPELVGQAKAVARLRHAARHAGSLAHECIVRIYDYDEPEPPDRPFLVTEFVYGLSLADALADGPLEASRVMAIVAQIGAVLEAAHRAGMAHCAVTSENILLSRNGLVKLTHFDTSHGDGSAASDLYSLGLVAYRCLVGGQPFGGPSSEAALPHQDNSAPPLPPGVHAEVAALVGQLVAEDPADRPGSAEEVARAAGELRDRLNPRAAAVDDRGPPTAALAMPAHRKGRAGLSVRRWTARTGRSRGGTRRDHRRLLAGAAVVTALTVWALISVAGPLAQHPAAGLPPRTTMVDVSGARLIGRTVAAASRQLRHLGLVVRVRWRPTYQALPGTVLSVRPTGWMASGSVVVVVGAQHPTVTAAPGQAEPIHGDRPLPAGRHHRKHRPRPAASPDPSGRPLPTPTPSSSPAPTASASPGPTGSPPPSASPDPTGNPSPLASR